MLISSHSICVSAPDTDNSVLWMPINIRFNLLSPSYNGDRWSYELSLQALSVWPHNLQLPSSRLDVVNIWWPTNASNRHHRNHGWQFNVSIIFSSECRPHFRQTLRPRLLDHKLWIRFHSYCRWRPRKRVHDLGRSGRLELLHLRLLTFAAKAQ